MTHIDVSRALSRVEAAIAGRYVDQDIPAPRTLDREDWPPDYTQVRAWRQMMVARFREDPTELDDAIAYYSVPDADHCIDWVNHWCDTFDPRLVGTGRSPYMPMVLFRRQEEFIRFVFDCLGADANGLVEKSRDMGATWTAIDVSAWLWRFQPGSVIGWGSNKQEQVDVLGNPKSIFEKIRMLLTGIEPMLMPEMQTGTHLKQYTCRNPDNGSVIDGEIGRGIGRGGRSRLYFVDEAAHLEHPEEVEASLSENTRCRIDISSVSGPGTVFHRKRMAGQEWVRGQPVRRDVANVFLFDWTDHPGKSREWYEERRAYFMAQGTPGVTAREIDRDYTAAAEGVIIKYEWVQAAVDAHIRLGFTDEGGWWGGLDVADGGVDTNALVRGKGSVVKLASEWGARDPGETARRAFALCRETVPISLQYDCIGLGAAVKSEYNRLTDTDEGREATRGISLTAWHAGAKVLDPAQRVVPNDPESPVNRDFFANFRAQAWWCVGRYFYRTWRALAGEEYPPEELISIDSSGMSEEILARLMRELAQATMGQDARLKLRVEKQPEGSKSPNLGDALIMGRYPARTIGGTRLSLFGPKVF